MTGTTLPPVAGRNAAPLRLGVSACLLGEEVRWDGGHQREAALVEGWGAQVDWVPVCPEVEMGLGVPRDPIQLVRTAEGIQLQIRSSGRDQSAAMGGWARERVQALAAMKLCGYVLKGGSPSCGKDQVPVHDARGVVCGVDRGFFAAELLRHSDGFPVEEAERLRDPRLRDLFLGRALAYRELCRPR